MASPWAKIEPSATSNFQDIMSEEFARGLQSEENKKYSAYLEKGLKDNSAWLKEQPGPSKEANEPETCEEIETEKKDTTPEDVMKIIKENPMLGAGTTLTDFCDSDEIIAQVLQAQFNSEYNEQLTRLEQQRNKQSKVSVSLENYRRHDENGLQDEESSDDDVDDHLHGDWDRFETNEKRLVSIPKCGFKMDEEGEMVTKHDPQLCGVRNACRVMSFPPEFSTGDAGGFDMKLPNAVYNQLKTYSRKSSCKKHKMHARKENAATAEMGMDNRTRLMLYKMINNQILKRVNGIISTGKEAVVLHADTDPSYPGDLVLPRECAIKIFKTTLNEFKQRDRYIKDDYSFKNRFSKLNSRVVINKWAEKEMLNIKRLQKYGITCPDALLLKKHVLVLSFIGENQNAAPKLKFAKLSATQLSEAYQQIVSAMHKMYNHAKLVHADLSEYNILWYADKCWFIDVAQSVTPSHPSALEFLMRDCHNIISYFERFDMPNLKTKEELFEYITSLSADVYNTAMLERIHTRGISVAKATMPCPDDTPEEFKPIAYPFDLAWEKAINDKKKSREAVCNVDEVVIETSDALTVMSMHQPAECNVACD